MASPSLKITLKLSGPKQADKSQPSSPASVKSVNKREDNDSPSIESPRKKAKTGNGRSRKPKSEGSSMPDTPITVDDDNADEAPSHHNKRGGGGGAGSSGQNTSTPISRKELLKHKDIKVRKWVTKPLVFYTLNGSEVQLPSWQSDEKMALNETTTEPITVAEIDQLFSSTAGEKDFRPFLCTQPGCSKSFTTFDQLQTHETNMHGTKKLVCGIDGCHKSFVTTGQLTKHRKMVHFRAARKAKIAAAAAAAAAAEATTISTTASGDNGEKDDEVATPTTANNGDNDSVDVANL